MRKVFRLPSTCQKATRAARSTASSRIRTRTRAAPSRASRRNRAARSRSRSGRRATRARWRHTTGALASLRGARSCVRGEGYARAASSCFARSPLGRKPDDLADRLATLEDQQRRDRADPVLTGGHRVLVGVELHELDAAVVLLGEFLDDRRDHAAGAAPGRPEVDQHRVVVLDHIQVERGVGRVSGHRHDMHFPSIARTRRALIQYPTQRQRALARGSSLLLAGL